MTTGIYKRTPDMKTGRHMLGKKLSENTKQKIADAKVGNKNPAWKTKVSYRSIHLWISQWKGKPRKCEKCGADWKQRYEWANVDHKYRRVLDDYIRMCVQCHKDYDKELRSRNIIK
jgi:hypothetical protein